MPDAEERKALFTCAFLAGSLLVAPGELRAAGICGSIGAALFAWHTVLGWREAKQKNAKGPAPAAAPGGGERAGDPDPPAPTPAG